MYKLTNAVEYTATDVIRIKVYVKQKRQRRDYQEVSNS